MESVASFVSIVLLLGVPLMVYFAPTALAVARGHHNEAPIFLLNLFLGWTFLGWVAALIWAVTATEGKS